MKKLLLATLIGAAVLPAALTAATISVNGEAAVGVSSWSYSGDVLTIGTTDATLRLMDPADGGALPEPEPEPGPGPGPEPGPEPGPSECGSLPSNVTLLATLDLANAGGRVTHNISGNTNIVSQPITSTSSNAAFSGQFAYVPTTGNGGINREVWVSDCPGASSYSASSILCRANGVQPTVYWKLSASSWQCNLAPSGGTKYLNIKNTNCSGTCGVNRNVFHNGES
ncbi:hypothetical protein [Nitrincola sp. MINF-07-Sa-05]|uniref:hypothetical protein n=1 Tax=Nitrincola salilacus TaxID=3400273 RepID=UPI003917D0E2